VPQLRDVRIVVVLRANSSDPPLNMFMRIAPSSPVHDATHG
jgi:hypothetical protein